MNRLVIGCGYLGSRVARRWRELGDTVWATTRHPQRAAELDQRGWHPLLADICQRERLKTVMAGLPPLDTVLVAVGYDRSSHLGRHRVYVDGLRNVLECLPESARHLIYISSTGVYGEANGQWVDEFTPPNPSREGGKAIWAAEQVLMNSRWKPRSTILRLAGLYGPGRIPNLKKIRERSQGQDTTISLGGFLNLVHVEDAAQAVVAAAERVAQGELFLISDGAPVLRRDYYRYLQRRANGGTEDASMLDPGAGERSGASGKRICNQKARKALNLTFQFPDYQSGVEHALFNEWT